MGLSRKNMRKAKREDISRGEEETQVRLEMKTVRGQMES